MGWSFVSLFLFFCFKTSVVENVVGSNVGGVIVMGAVADGMLTVGIDGSGVGVRWWCSDRMVCRYGLFVIDGDTGFWGCGSV